MESEKQPNWEKEKENHQEENETITVFVFRSYIVYIAILLGLTLFLLSYRVGQYDGEKKSINNIKNNVTTVELLSRIDACNTSWHLINDDFDNLRDSDESLFIKYMDSLVNLYNKHTGGVLIDTVINDTLFEYILEHK